MPVPRASEKNDLMSTREKEGKGEGRELREGREKDIEDSVSREGK